MTDEQQEEESIDNGDIMLSLFLFPTAIIAAIIIVYSDDKGE